MLDINSFTLRQYIVEARFPHNFALWDKAGALWKSLQPHFKDLKLVKGQPTQTSFTSEPNIELTVELNRLIFIAHRERSETAKDQAAKFIDHVIRKLEINQFTRIGLRQVFERRFDSQSAADNEFSSLGLTTIRPGRFFGIESQSLTNSEVATRIFDGKNGIHVRLRSETIRSQLDVPIAARDDFDEKVVSHPVLILDVDWYIDAAVTTDVFNAPLWLDQASRVIRRDMGDFLRGPR